MELNRRPDVIVEERSPDCRLWDLWSLCEGMNPTLDHLRGEVCTRFPSARLHHVFGDTEVWVIPGEDWAVSVGSVVFNGMDGGIVLRREGGTVR